MLNCKHVSWKRFGSCQLTLSQRESRSGDGECAAHSSREHTRQTADQPPFFPLPVPSIIFIHCLQTLQDIGHMFSASYYENVSPITLFFSGKERANKKKHKHTNGCILGPWKGNYFFVIWIRSGLGTSPKRQVPSLVVFGVINIVNLQESGLSFTGMAEGTCDTKVRILWTIQSGTWWMELWRARSWIPWSLWVPYHSAYSVILWSGWNPWGH